MMGKKKKRRNFLPEDVTLCASMGPRSLDDSPTWIMVHGKPRRYLRTVDAANYLGLSASLLRKLRLADKGPECIKLSASMVVYEIPALDRWVALHKGGLI